MMAKKTLFLALSFGLTGLLLYLIFSQTTSDQWLGLLSRIKIEVLLIYVGLYGLGLSLRTWRYHLLIKGAGPALVPAFGRLALVTAVRNMLVDFLPARTGSLSYLVILNRVFAVDFSACLTSFTYAALFDLLSLGPILAAVLAIDHFRGSVAHPLLWGLGIVITLGGFTVIVFLEPLFQKLSGWIERKTFPYQERHPWLKGVARELTAVSRSFLSLRRARLFWPLFGLSLLLRAIKYTLIYLLLFAVMTALLEAAPALPFLKIMFGIMGSEVAASLPISGIAGFGLYEGILGMALTSQGIQASQGIFISFAMHLLSQIFEYSLGGAALILIGISWWRSGDRLHNQSPTVRIDGQALEPESGRPSGSIGRIYNTGDDESEEQLLKFRNARAAGLKTVLFICTGNAVRSQMAEALVNHFLKGRWAAFSAGFLPAGISPPVVKALKEIGIDAARQPTKHLDLFNGLTFDRVITLCSDADRMCTFYPAYGNRVHLPYTDPLTLSTFGLGWKGLFRKLRDDMKNQLIPYLEAENREKIQGWEEATKNN
jgi:protein-tyrosine-phosphatase